jgi:hypothetical protein
VSDFELKAARLHQRVTLVAFERPAERLTGRCEGCPASCDICTCLAHVEPAEPFRTGHEDAD